MICMDINLKLYFDNVAKDSDNKKCESAIEELFDTIFCGEEEYIRTDAQVQDIKEVV